MTKWIKEHNILYWALSLLIAVALWVYVSVSQDPEKSKTLNDITVDIIDEDIYLSPNNLMLLSGKDYTLDLVLEGRLADLNKIDKSNVRAVVTLKNVKNEGQHNLEIKIEGPSALNNVRVTQSRTVITIGVDIVKTKQVPIKLQLESSIAEGYIRGTAEFTPSTVEVRGPASVLIKINEALVVVNDKEDISKTIERRVDYTLVREDGTQENSTYISTDVTDVLMTLPVVYSKTVPLKLLLEKGGGLSEQNISYSLNPPTILISGDPGILDGINSISVGTLNLAELLGNETREYTLTLPDNVKNEDRIQTVTAVITILGAGTRDLMVFSDNFTIKGEVPDGYRAVFISKQLFVTLRGPEDQIDDIALHNIRVVVEIPVGGLAPGKHNLPAAVYLDGFSDCGVVDKKEIYTITIDIVVDDGDSEQ